jgi:hypothetical protein
MFLVSILKVVKILLLVKKVNLLRRCVGIIKNSKREGKDNIYLPTFNVALFNHICFIQID